MLNDQVLIVGAVICAGNKEVMKVQMGPNGTGVGAKQKSEEMINGSSLSGKYNVVRNSHCLIVDDV